MEFLNISLKEALILAGDQMNYQLIDVREPYRYKEEHLSGALNRPYGILKPEDQLWEKTLIVYCDFGGQSMMAARHLEKEGYQAYNVVGGVYYYLLDKKDS